MLIGHSTWSSGDIAAWVEARGRVDPDAVSWFESWATTNRWRDHIHQLSCPGLLVTGDLAPTVTANMGAEASRLWPQLRVGRIRLAGHNVRRDQFDRFGKPSPTSWSFDIHGRELLRRQSCAVP